MSKDYPHTNDVLDAEVSAAYRTLDAVSCPDELDRKILRQAKHAASSKPGSDWMTGWLRPAAFVATLGLSVAFLLEVSFFQTMIQEDESALGDTMQMPAAQQRIDTEQQSRLPTATRENEQSAAFRNAASATAEQMRAADATADARLKDMPKVESSAEKSDAVGTSNFCSTLQRQNVDDWQRCIRELRDRGNDEAAMTETREMQRRYPQSSLP